MNRKRFYKKIYASKQTFNDFDFLNTCGIVSIESFHYYNNLHIVSINFLHALNYTCSCYKECNSQTILFYILNNRFFQ